MFPQPAGTASSARPGEPLLRVRILPKPGPAGQSLPDPAGVLGLAGRPRLPPDGLGPVPGIVEQPADGRFGLGRDLDEVQPPLPRHPPRRLHAHHPHVLVAIVDHTDLPRPDLVVDPQLPERDGDSSAMTGGRLATADLTRPRPGGLRF